jgi:hypothetical protein
VLIRQGKSAKDVIWNGFLKPFSLQLWLLVIMTQLVIVVCLNMFNRFKLWCFGRISSESPDSHDSVYSLGMFFMQGQGKAVLMCAFISAFKPQQNVEVFLISGVTTKTRVTSQRMLCLVAQLTALTLHTGYTAFFISFLSVQKFSLPFDSLRELVDIGSYRLGVLANSGQLNIFNVSHVIVR